MRPALTPFVPTNREDKKTLLYRTDGHDGVRVATDWQRA